jgi:hypothetical protein
MMSKFAGEVKQPRLSDAASTPRYQERLARGAGRIRKPPRGGANHTTTIRRRADQRNRSDDPSPASSPVCPGCSYRASEPAAKPGCMPDRSEPFGSRGDRSWLQDVMKGLAARLGKAQEIRTTRAYDWAGVDVTRNALTLIVAFPEAGPGKTICSTLFVRSKLEEEAGTFP